MAWDDIVFGVLTGGIYNLGKTVYKAGEAAEEAGDAVEEVADSVGKAIAVIAESATKMMEELGSFVHELEGMVTVKRSTPRSEDDLWEEELERLTALRAREAELVTELEALGADLAEIDSFSDLFTYLDRMMEVLSVQVKLAVVRSAIHEILYEEPGVVPETLYQVRGILERFHTLEQPRIEGLMDSAGEGMEEVNGILVEVKKLFVVTKWKKVELSTLPAPLLEKLRGLEARRAMYDSLITKSTLVADALQGGLEKVQPSEVSLPRWGRGAGIPLPKKAVSPVMEAGPVKKAGLVAGKAISPAAEKIGARFNNTTVTAYLGAHDTLLGRVRFFEVERLKVEKEIFRITWMKVEEPGVIPKTFDEVHLSLNRFRTEEQPRIELIMDNVSETVVEAKDLLVSLDLTAKETTSLIANMNESM
ncbi:MAG: hypothetical protein LUO96_03160, partial [Methanomicrobiales archaeon]|nr:hypothetical protein [Methanomicrobiales archaeon]